MGNITEMSDVEKKVLEKMKEVVDPEFGFPIVDRGLLDEIKVEGKRVTIKYHLTVPFCPRVFAIFIGKQIKEKAKEVGGIEEVEVICQQHIQAEEINKALREEE